MILELKGSVSGRFTLKKDSFAQNYNSNGVIFAKFFHSVKYILQSLFEKSGFVLSWIYHDMNLQN